MVASPPSSRIMFGAVPSGPGQRLLGAPPVLLERLALPGEDGDALGVVRGAVRADRDRGGGVVLGGEDVAAGPADLGAEGDQGLDQDCGLDRHVQGADDPGAAQRLGVARTPRGSPSGRASRARRAGSPCARRRRGRGRRPCSQCSCTSSLIGLIGVISEWRRCARSAGLACRPFESCRAESHRLKRSGDEYDGTGFGRVVHAERAVLDRRLLELLICASRRPLRGSACPPACSATVRGWGCCLPSGSGAPAGCDAGGCFRGLPLPGPGTASTPRRTWRRSPPPFAWSSGMTSRLPRWPSACAC